MPTEVTDVDIITASNETIRPLARAFLEGYYTATRQNNAVNAAAIPARLTTAVQSDASAVIQDNRSGEGLKPPRAMDALILLGLSARLVEWLEDVNAEHQGQAIASLHRLAGRAQ